MILFCRWLFWIAGTTGLLMLFPMYFLESKINADQPPAITHPEFFYGFVGLGIAWQLAFLVIGTDPLRYRWLMPPAVVEKFTFGLAVLALYLQGRAPQMLLPFATIDLTLGILFAAAFFLTRPQK